MHKGPTIPTQPVYIKLITQAPTRRNTKKCLDVELLAMYNGKEES